MTHTGNSGTEHGEGKESFGSCLLEEPSCQAAQPPWSGSARDKLFRRFSASRMLQKPIDASLYIVGGLKVIADIFVETLAILLPLLTLSRLFRRFSASRMLQKPIDASLYIVGGLKVIAELWIVIITASANTVWNCFRAVLSPLVLPLARLMVAINRTSQVQAVYAWANPATRLFRKVFADLAAMAAHSSHRLGLLAAPRHHRQAGPHGLRIAGAISITIILAASALGISAFSKTASSIQYPRRHQAAAHHQAYVPLPTSTTTPNASWLIARLAAELKNHLAFKKATTPPAPLPPNLASGAPLSPHEVFAFLPYWSLNNIPQVNFSDLTTVSYFAVHLQANGSIIRSGSGWSGLQSQQLSDFITSAHQASTRVVLTVNCFSQSSLNNLSAHPVSTGTTLAQQVIAILRSKNLDGLNLDLEGTGAQDRHGLARFVGVVSTAIRASDPHWQVTMDTYASSAGDPYGFFDILRLAPSVNAFFIMAYDMNATGTPSPTSPLSNGAGYSAQTALSEYTSVVPGSKVILGLPFYGYVWPTSGPSLGDPATGEPTPETYSQIASGGHQVYWDPSTNTPWVSYQVGSQWYQAFFDNPMSIALKVRMANSYGLRGVGAWALGMEGSHSSMLAALTGNTSVIKTPPQGPTVPPSTPGGNAPTSTTSTTSTPPSGSGSSSTTGRSSTSSTGTGSSTTTTEPASSFYGIYSGKKVALTLTTRASISGYHLYPSGTLTGFETSNPSFSCLTATTQIPVYSVAGSPQQLVAQVVKGPQCTSGTWLFSIRPATSTTSASTTTSTTPAQDQRSFKFRY
ncbi:MAG: glycosyl hydrolase family 18 protein [Acidimicrobiales bacterium]